MESSRAIMSPWRAARSWRFPFTMPEHQALTEGLALMFHGIERLRSAFPNRHFTIDGRLVGDVGEVIAGGRRVSNWTQQDKISPFPRPGVWPRFMDGHCRAVNQEIFCESDANAARIRRCEQWHHACYRSRSFARSPSWTAGKNTHRTCGRRQFTPPVMPCNGPHARPAEQGRHT
jgi:hypothetical protein